MREDLYLSTSISAEQASLKGSPVLDGAQYSGIDTTIFGEYKEIEDENPDELYAEVRRSKRRFDMDAIRKYRAKDKALFEEQHPTESEQISIDEIF